MTRIAAIWSALEPLASVLANMGISGLKMRLEWAD